MAARGAARRTDKPRPERLVGKLLKIHHPVARQQIEGVPSGVVELHPFAWHADLHFS
jgi:hypothetical protein